MLLLLYGTGFHRPCAQWTEGDIKIKCFALLSTLPPKRSLRFCHWARGNSSYMCPRPPTHWAGRICALQAQINTYPIWKLPVARSACGFMPCPAAASGERVDKQTYSHRLCLCGCSSISHLAAGCVTPSPSIPYANLGPMSLCASTGPSSGMVATRDVTTGPGINHSIS